MSESHFSDKIRFIDWLTPPYLILEMLITLITYDI